LEDAVLKSATPDGTTETSSAAAIRLANDLAGRYRITSLEPLLRSCRAFAREDTLNVAVLGRFKAGKSSFLNHLVGRQILPVGVIPVTTVVTEISYGREERAEVRYVDGRSEVVSPSVIGDYIDETRNPENRKHVSLVRIELPSLQRFRGVRFVDTPGLESVLAHNTDASREWLPNVGLAVVAVGVDPPLSQRDIELIRELDRYTPNVSLLLTKVDVLDDSEREQVRQYVRTQLDRYWNGMIPIFPYSIRPEYEQLRQDFERMLLAEAVARSGEKRSAILSRKMQTLLKECASYLSVALKSAEAADSEKRLLRRKILGEKQSLEDSKLALRLIVRHTITNTRTEYEKLLEKRERGIRDKLMADFEERFPDWAGSFKKAARDFENWLEPRITAEIRRVSNEHRQDFIEPLHRVGRQLSQSLQDFRNRISERTVEALGVPLQTTEVEIEPEIPRAPDIRIGKLFDREWELISFLIPMPIVKGIVENHFRRTIADVVFKNLSRLASQWEGVVNAALAQMEKEAMQRLENLVGTIEHLLSSAVQEAPRIREDADRVEQLRALLEQAPAGAGTPEPANRSA
jgi:GTP-binding protein EngB required for normal cell division